MPNTTPAGHAGSPPRLWGIRARPPTDGSGSAVHPHACGEYARVMQPSALATPVHPHACGEYETVDLVGLSEPRFTPTPVGNTFDQGGELRLGCGSPPRLWGIPLARLAGGDKPRFTPTPVGNTSPSRSTGSDCSVHPHACGEYACTARALHVAVAVHPHACGEYPLADGGRPPPARFTPTPVGNTTLVRLLILAQPVHPHACGEYPVTAASGFSITRFTPTPVGNTCGATTSSLTRRFTPTPVGNTGPITGALHSIIGSPPRLWGILAQKSVERLNLAVHPHACGEYSRFAWWTIVLDGSPPRLWGIRTGT